MFAHADQCRPGVLSRQKEPMTALKEEGRQGRRKTQKKKAIEKMAARGSRQSEEGSGKRKERERGRQRVDRQNESGAQR